MKEERVTASTQLDSPRGTFSGDKKAAVGWVRDALYASKIISYAQGFMLMKEAANEYGWRLNYGGVALMWRGGCIIRSKFLDNIKQAFDHNESLRNLLLDEFFAHSIRGCDSGWREAIRVGIDLGIPTPAFSAALSFFDGYRSARLPANLPLYNRTEL